MDELAKKRFEKIAKGIAFNLQMGKQAVSDMNAAAASLEVLLTQYLEGLQRVTGMTRDIERIEHEIRVSWKTFEEPEIVAAIDAAFDHFDTASVALARLVDAVPKDDPSA